MARAGKETWFTARQDLVEAKGKGFLKTFWLKQRIDEGNASQHSDSSDPTDTPALNSSGKGPDSNDSLDRLIDWNTQTLGRFLKQIIAQRKSGEIRVSRAHEQAFDNGGTVLEEVCEVISLPEFDPKTATASPENVDAAKLPDKVSEELRSYVVSVASMYKDNPFHNFAHASHVVMSTVKLLSRIIMKAPEENESTTDFAATLHDHTYG